MRQAFNLQLKAARALIALTVMAAVPGLAQLKPEAQLGSRVPVKPDAVDPSRAGLVKKGFAQCLYRKAAPKIATFLENSDPASVDFDAAKIAESRLSKELGMDSCLSEQVDATQLGISLTFSPVQLRAMLQEEAYLFKHKVAPSLPEASVEDVNRKYVSGADVLPTAKSMGGFADCIVFRNTAGADAVLRTTPGSKDEQASARALAPTLGDCLVQGHTLTLRPANIRVFAADGLWTRYVRSHAAVPAPAR